MKVLVTGAMGQVGQEVVLAFQACGHQVIALSSKELDISQESQVEAILTQHDDCDFIINCAAYTAVDKAEADADRAYQVNALGVRYLALAARKLNIPLVHLSTDYVFDGNKNSAYIEDDLANPQSVYGKTKWQGEEFLREILVEHVIVRVSWVFGRFGHNFVKTMLRLFQERSELGIVDDQKGGPTPAADIAQTLLKICEVNLTKPYWGTYHYCGAPAITWYDFAVKIYALAQNKLVGKGCQLKAILSSAYPLPAQRPKNSVLSTHKIEIDFGIKPASWELGLEQVLVALGMRS